METTPCLTPSPTGVSRAAFATPFAENARVRTRRCLTRGNRSPPELRCSGPDWYEFGDFCYKPFQEKKSWRSAREACRSLGADLASIVSMTEQSWLQSYLYMGTETRTAKRSFARRDLLGFFFSVLRSHR